MNKELLLTRDAFQALIRLVNGSTVAGLPLHEWTLRSTSDAVMQGSNELSERGLSNDIHVRTLAQVVAHPDRVVIINRDREALPRQEWMFYEKAGHIVEQTLPARAVHRLTTITGGERELVDRLMESLRLTDISGPNGQMLISQSLFQEIVRVVRAEARRGEAQDLLFAAGVPASLVESLLEALEHPVFAAVIVFLKVAGDEAIDARELTLLQGIRSMWAIHQEPIGEPQVKLALTDKRTVRSTIEAFFSALS